MSEGIGEVDVPEDPGRLTAGSAPLYPRVADGHVPHGGTERSVRVSDGEDQLMSDLRQQARSLAADVGPLRRICVRRGDAVVEIEWHGDRRPTDVQPPTAAPPLGPAANPGAAVAEPATAAEPAPLGQDGMHTVVSPMVGTFYRAPEPGAPPFVTVGDVVAHDRAVGIVEAMKLMNEVAAGQAGRVVQVLVEDGQPVEYDQPLVILASV